MRKLGFISQIIYLYLGFMLLTSSFADSPKALKIVTENYPPYEMEQAVDGLRGFDFDVMQAAFTLLGYKLEVDFLPWKRALNYTRRGEVVGILTCAYRKEREEFILFSDPISEFTNGFYMRKGFDGPKPEILEDVIGQKVASISAYESLTALESIGANPLSIPTTKSAIKMLNAKRFDYLYVNQQATDFAIKKLGLADMFDFYPISKQSFHFCFSKPYEGSDLLLEEFNKALYILKNNGTYNAIHDKYR